MDSDSVSQLPRLSRSKSHEHLSTIVDEEDTTEQNYFMNHFARHGAIRKRTPDTDITMYKKHSEVALEKLSTNIELSCHTDQSQINKDNSKRRKGSLVSLGGIKEFWMTFKGVNREREETRRQTSENSNSAENSFLHKLGKKISETTYHPVVLMDASWPEILGMTEILSKTELDLQAAIWEIIETEANFIKQLSIVVNIFYPVLEELLLNYHDEVLHIRIQDVFGNIKVIYCNHFEMWNNYISSIISSAKIRNQFDISLMRDCFCKISSLLNGYVEFMPHLSSMRNTISKLQKESSIFNQYLQWTKTYDRVCHEGHLCALSLPFQRITRYKLLLERVKSLSSQAKHEDIDEMIESVHTFVKQINSSIHGQYKTDDIKEKLVDVNVINGFYSDVHKWWNDEELTFDITRPLTGYQERILVHEGRLKMRKCGPKVLEVQCYLCNDMFLICKPVKGNWNRLRICKTPIRLDKLLIKEHSEGSFFIAKYSDFNVVENLVMLQGGCDDVKLWLKKCTETKLAFLSQYTEHNGTNRLYATNSHDATIPTEEVNYASTDFQGKLCHSDTMSSVSSTISTDSAFSQTSSSLTPTEIYGKISPLKYFNSRKSRSAENMSTINEEFLYKFVPVHDTIPSVDYGEGPLL